VHDFASAAAFAEEVGYPVVVKPDNGVGANKTYRLQSKEELGYFFATKDACQYIMEELVHGVVRTYDAIIDQDGNPIFETGNVTPSCIMDVVNTGDNSIYYIVKELPETMLDIGRRTVAAFGVKGRFVHMEYFELTQDQEGLGKAGDIVGLEVNMRPSGGYTPDMYNFAYETDVYKIWADMIAFNKSTKPLGNRHTCAFVGLRDGKKFRMTDEDIRSKYAQNIKLAGRIPDALAAAMGNRMYIANFDTDEEREIFFRDLLEEI
jgi:biotin carboxylase